MKNPLKNAININDLLSGVLSSAQDEEILEGIKACQDELDNKGRRNSTVRLPPMVHSYFTTHAKRLNTSFQDLITITLTSLVANNTESSQYLYSHQRDNALKRFYSLFKLHNVPLVHARYVIESLDYKGFPIQAFSSFEELGKVINPKLLGELSRFFDVNIEWLNGEAVPVQTLRHVPSRDFIYRIADEIAAGRPAVDDSSNSKHIVLVKSNKDEREFLLYVVHQIVLDSQMSFKVFSCGHYIHLSNLEAAIGLEAIIRCVENKTFERTSMYSVMLDDVGYNRILAGYSAAAIVGRDNLLMMDSFKHLDILDNNKEASDALAKAVASSIG